jgi:hypothetical protein
MQAALTSHKESRPMCDSEISEGCELSERLQRIPVKKIAGGVRKRSALKQKLRGQTECFARGLAAQARSS